MKLICKIQLIAMIAGIVILLMAFMLGVQYPETAKMIASSGLIIHVFGWSIFVVENPYKEEN